MDELHLADRVLHALAEELVPPRRDLALVPAKRGLLLAERPVPLGALGRLQAELVAELHDDAFVGEGLHRV